ncbi:unnamed protein product [Lepeophtheirus salmonis]|uniref:(salmon louse) hypothetical protein n=1 Tax=Lepeophtheirus salmonis TaxID=72036 RepID=A0A7R8H4D3_LEPSM|nr:unnamed protein product [Lepeophtheirus salmonis]CAF2860803.1 unnamed protein product [Lepeophtheirus salmonis]
MVGEAWDTQDTKDLIQRIMKDITMRQLNLSLNKGIFEGKQKECKQIIKKIFEDLSSWASKTEHDILKQVDDVAERRRREMGRNELLSDLLTFPISSTFGCSEQSWKLSNKVEAYSGYLAQSLFLDGNTDELFQGQIHIDIGVSPNSPPIQSFILSEMSLSVLSSEQRLLITTRL